MAITGNDVCAAGWNGNLIKMKHSIKFGYAEAMSAKIIWIATTNVANMMAILCYCLLKFKVLEFPDKLTYVEIWVLTGIVYFPCLWIGTISVGLCSSSISAMFHCVAIDMDLNYGTPMHGSPKFQSSMRGILGIKEKKNRTIKSSADN